MATGHIVLILDFTAEDDVTALHPGLTLQQLASWEHIYACT
jgi:hypothetical protein